MVTGSSLLEPHLRMDTLEPNGFAGQSGPAFLLRYQDPYRTVFHSQVPQIQVCTTDPKPSTYIQGPYLKDKVAGLLESGTCQVHTFPTLGKVCAQESGEVFPCSRASWQGRLILNFQHDPEGSKYNQLRPLKYDKGVNDSLSPKPFPPKPLTSNTRFNSMYSIQIGPREFNNVDP